MKLTYSKKMYEVEYDVLSKIVVTWANINNKTKGASILTNTKKDAFYVFIKSKSASPRHAL